MRAPMRRTTAILALAVSVGLLPALIGRSPAHAQRPQLVRATAPPSTYDDVAGAQLLARQINADRAAHGLPPMAIRQDLTAIAVQHSRAMAAAGRIWHNDELFSDSTRSRLRAAALGENVGLDGQGGAATSHQMYMDSPAHRANVLDPRFTAMGIAVTVADGIAYSTEDFMQAAAPPTPPPPPPPPAPTPPPGPAPRAEPAVTMVAVPAAPTGTTPTRFVDDIGAAAAGVDAKAPATAVADLTGTRPGPPISPEGTAALAGVNAVLAGMGARAARRGRLAGA